ncbi:hypothetical protein [Streptomyces sp. NPDC048442]|uniref:hypothetical protein n=1 Tax=Streptomyces sp. NPDC048442 TaxID=3154823 RepID=UPI00341EF877
MRATYARQAGCPGDFAAVTVDFEPWEEGFAFEVGTQARVPDLPEVPGYLAALEAGLREELEVPEADTDANTDTAVSVAVAVVLRDLRIHEVDSRDGSFHEAGRIAVRNAFIRLYGPPPRPRRGRPRRGRPTGRPAPPPGRSPRAEA